MSKGFKATLFAGVITLSAFAPAFAAAPVIAGLPDVHVGDLEDSTEATDSNLFVFTDAFQFSDYVTDAETSDSSQLIWSFAEYTRTGEGLGANQYTINGVGPHSNGEAAIADEQLAGNPKAKLEANRINTSPGATFRDIILSPPSGTVPFAEPTADQKTAAAAGKFVRYYVADPEGNVSSREALVKSVDDQNDKLVLDQDGYQEETRDTDFGTSWVPSGLLSPGVTINNPDDGNLKITVTPTQGRTRILGWKNEGMMGYDEVGPSKFVHGKFYIYTTNNILSPINTVPAFRLRISNESLDAAVNFEYAQTGYTGTEAEPGYVQANSPEAELNAGFFVRPSDLVNTPSLYKVDFDPVDVPAAAGTRIGALMESFAIPDPANGTLTLTEVVLGTYDAKDDSNGNLVYEYDSAVGLAGTAGTAGGAKSIESSGVFNAENDFEPGRRQKLFVPSRDPLETYATIEDQEEDGLLATTAGTRDDVFAIGLLNVVSVNNVDKLRIEPSKFYRAKFYATSDVPARRNPAVDIQSGFRFRFQTGSNTISYLMELVGVAQTVTANGGVGDELSIQALPGPDSQNPDTDAAHDVAGEKGGWYSILVSSPLDPDGIREDYEELAETFGEEGGKGFFTFYQQPGPGAAGDSAKDVLLGADIFSTPTDLRNVTGPNTVIEDFAQQNVSAVRVTAIEVYEYAPIDDGGYDFVPPVGP